MIIPVRCFTCGNVIADKWTPFVKLVMEKKNESTENVDSELDIQYINITEDGSIKKSITSGSDFLIVGRTFLGSKNPARTAKQLQLASA